MQILEREHRCLVVNELAHEQVAEVVDAVYGLAAHQSAGHHGNRRGAKKGFAWYAGINNDSSLDVSISLLLTERTLVKEADGAMYVENIPEPPPPDPVTPPVEMWSNGELVSKWNE
uniref:phage tail protein n=1 Tax=Klebsiella variicola TaxID=244366 RepID=UPI002B1BE411|nr:phage tail protein [Klebsiella variicola]